MDSQLPLGIHLRVNATYDNYLVGSNLEAVKALQQADAAQCIYIWGGTSTGKTHLMQATCHAAATRDEAIAYIPLSQSKEFSPAFLEGLEGLPLVCIDDIQCIAGEKAWEEALFHLYNNMRESNARLIVTANASPRAIGLTLPDLSSRLSWGLVFQLTPLTDDEKGELLQLRAHHKGMNMPEEVASYLLKRCARDLPALLELLERLDRESLAAQRRLTIPFIKEVLGSE